jgi:hypothetical protein
VTHTIKSAADLQEEKDEADACLRCGTPTEEVILDAPVCETCFGTASFDEITEMAMAHPG